MNKTIYNFKDIERLLGCKRSKAYSVIRSLNNELLEQGSEITAGKIPSYYFHERFKGFQKEVKK